MPPQPTDVCFALQRPARLRQGKRCACGRHGLPLSLCFKCQRKPRAGPSTQGLSIGNTYFPL